MGGLRQRRLQSRRGDLRRHLLSDAVTTWQGVSVDYAYDDGGRLSSATLPNGIVTCHGYDDASRLTSARNTLDGAMLSVYAYPDAGGNRGSKADGSGTTDYTYQSSIRLAQAGDTQYTWDDAGNLTARGSDTFAYDYESRLIQAVVDGITSTYTYNGDGLRVAKSVSGGASDAFVWDVGAGLPLLISDTRYLYSYGLGPIGMVDGEGNAFRAVGTLERSNVATF